MKYDVIRFKNLKICLNELEPFIKDGQHLETGKPFKRFKQMRSREVLANWLLCVVLNFIHETDKYFFSTDPDGGDGIISNGSDKQNKTEHILVSNTNEATEIESLILKAIEKKNLKGGKSYASGKSLIIFLNKAGSTWVPNKVAKKLDQNSYFNDIWIVGLQTILNEEYLYNVIMLNKPISPIWQVCVEKNFENWHVKQIQ